MGRSLDVGLGMSILLPCRQIKEIPLCRFIEAPLGRRFRIEMAETKSKAAPFCVVAAVCQ